MKKEITTQEIQAIERQNNVTKALSEQLGLIAQFKLIVANDTNTQFVKFLKEHFEKSHFAVVGFMTVSEIFGQIKTPGNYKIEFVKQDFKTNVDENNKKLRQSLSYKLYLRAFATYLNNEIDFLNLKKKGEILRNMFNDLRNVDNRIEILDYHFKNFNSYKELSVSQMRYVYDFKNNKLNAYFTTAKDKATFEDFEVEDKFNELDDQIKRKMLIAVESKGQKRNAVNAFKHYTNLQEKLTQKETKKAVETVKN